MRQGGRAVKRVGEDGFTVIDFLAEVTACGYL